MNDSKGAAFNASGNIAGEALSEALLHRLMDWNVCGESYTPERTTYVNFLS